MIDGIIKGTGNSRFLRSVPNIKALYPTYDDLLDALAAGTLPIDLNGINPAGWEDIGTAINKSSLLTDILCTNLGLSETATPTQAMDKLWQLVNTAQNGVDNGLKMQIVSYVGTGLSGKDNPTSVTFSFAPRIVMLLGYTYQFNGKRYWNSAIGYGVSSGNARTFLLLPSTMATTFPSNELGFGFLGETSYLIGKKSTDGKTIIWYATNEDQANNKDYTYYFAAIS